MLNKPKVIIFDWDDTLADNWSSIHVALNSALLGMGKEEWSFDKMKQNIRESLRDSFPKLFGKDWKKAEKIFYESLYTTHLTSLEGKICANELLQYLINNQITLGIVSNKSGDLLRAECQHLGWNDYFVSVIGANDAKRDKPAPDPIYLLLSSINQDPGKDVWFVGDSETDLKCAKNAGITSVIVNDKPIKQISEKLTPDFVFKSLAEMRQFVTKLEQRL